MDADRLRVCANPICIRPFEAYLKVCPHCGHAYTPQARESIKQVDGDVFELSAETLKALREQVDDNMQMPATPYGAPYTVVAGMQNRFREKVAELDALRESMATWCGWKSISNERRYGRTLTNAEQAKAFYFAFGVDVITAKTLDRKDAASLRERVQKALLIDNVVTAQV